MAAGVARVETESGVFLGPPAKPSDLGTLGPYRVIRAIGKGGMGMVFLGVDPKLRRKVALKVMLPKYLAKPQARERFLREARALAAVENEHVVPIYSVDEDSGTPYIALKYLQGSTLEEYLQAGQPLNTEQKLHLLREVATGLQAAHEHNVVHRDVKPENIWLEAPEGRVKLIDFGLARLPTQNTTNTSEGVIIGTPAYMSPEQARGQEVDARSDLFSLGGVIYRLFAGRPPFKADTAFNTVLALTQQPHVPLAMLCPEVPEGISKLVDSLLQKDPSQRPASAKDVVKELKRLEAQPRGSGVYTTIAISDAASSTWAALETDEPTATASASARLTPPREDKPIWPWVAGAVVIAIGVLVLALSSGGSKTPNTAAADTQPRRVTKSSATTPVATPPKSPVDPFTPLFNGRDLSGWRPFKDLPIDRWKMIDGVVVANVEQGAGEYLISDATFGSTLDLRGEYRITTGTDAGIVLFAGENTPGIEVQIADDASVKGFRAIFANPRHKHGSFFNLQAPLKSNAKPLGEWNAIRITAKAGKLVFEENGQIVNEQDFTAQGEKKAFRTNHPGLFEGKAVIALQCKAGAVEFRNLKAKE